MMLYAIRLLVFMLCLAACIPEPFGLACVISAFFTLFGGLVEHVAICNN